MPTMLGSGNLPYRKVDHNGLLTQDVNDVQGKGSVILNFEDASLYGPLSNIALTVGTGPAVLVPRMRFSQVIAIANTSTTATIYLGSSNVTTVNGWPIGPGEKQSFEFLANLDFYLIADAAGVDVRILQVASRG